MTDETRRRVFLISNQVAKHCESLRTSGLTFPDMAIVFRYCAEYCDEIVARRTFGRPNTELQLEIGNKIARQLGAEEGADRQLETASRDQAMRQAVEAFGQARAYEMISLWLGNARPDLKAGTPEFIHETERVADQVNQARALIFAIANMPASRKPSTGDRRLESGDDPPALPPSLLGVFRLRWLLLFFFCDDCWQDRREQCEKLMAGACSLPPKASDTGRDGAHVVPAHASGGAL